MTEGGGARSITVTVALDGAPRTTATQVTVSRTGGTATSGTDYAAVSDFTLTIPANQTSRMGTLTFRPINDNVSEGDEEVELSASATGLAVGTAILTITDDDPLPTAIELSASPDRVTENGGARTVTVTAALDRSTLPVSTSVLVTLSAGTATQGADYQAASPFNLSIPFGQASGTATFEFTPLDDSAEEGDETVILTGRASQEGLTPGTVTLTISDDESVPTGVLLSLSPNSVDEDAGRTSVTVTAALNRGIREAATPVRVTLKGASAAAGEDFQAVSPFTVTIPVGEPSVTGSFTLRPVNDSIAEGTETLEAVGTASGLVEGRAALADRRRRRGVRDGDPEREPVERERVDERADGAGDGDAGRGRAARADQRGGDLELTGGGIRPGPGRGRGGAVHDHDRAGAHERLAQLHVSAAGRRAGGGDRVDRGEGRGDRAAGGVGDAGADRQRHGHGQPGRAVRVAALRGRRGRST